MDRQARPWLRTEALPQLSRRLTRLTFDADYETVLATKARRDRLDAAIEEMAADSRVHPVVRRLGCLRGIGILTGFALAVEIGDWHRFTGNTIGSFVGLVPSRALLRQHRARARSPRPATATSADCWSRPPGTTGRATPSARPCERVGIWPRQQQGSGVTRATVDSTTAGCKFIDRKKRSTIADVAIARELAGWCWSLAVMDDEHPSICFVDQRLVTARGVTRDRSYEQPHPGG